MAAGELDRASCDSDNGKLSSVCRLEARAGPVQEQKMNDPRLSVKTLDRAQETRVEGRPEPCPVLQVITITVGPDAL